MHGCQAGPSAEDNCALRPLPKRGEEAQGVLDSRMDPVRCGRIIRIRRRRSAARPSAWLR
jgi:hypothetical protein